jgi:hypothetical protein
MAMTRRELLANDILAGSCGSAPPFREVVLAVDGML